ncbi:uncharacterized protein LOC128876294 isoform X2 [Hylaeus volcanicus]|uniref:uncharacterized protein LOC128876294 isoform X2 n=1 Tax=Hylaeus volcanicus TaxID=313075 RepID=UPI0023B7EBB0|nr:uncharacterized protein LOC128876294 isoform X2 [Hylaeus volcanicus]
MLGNMCFNREKGSEASGRTPRFPLAGTMRSSRRHVDTKVKRVWKREEINTVWKQKPRAINASMKMYLLPIYIPQLSWTHGKTEYTRAANNAACPEQTRRRDGAYPLTKYEKDHEGLIKRESQPWSVSTLVLVEDDATPVSLEDDCSVTIHDSRGTFACAKGRRTLSITRTACIIRYADDDRRIKNEGYRNSGFARTSSIVPTVEGARISGPGQGLVARILGLDGPQNRFRLDFTRQAFLLFFPIFFFVEDPKEYDFANVSPVLRYDYQAVIVHVVNSNYVSSGIIFNPCVILRLSLSLSLSRARTAVP